MTVPNSQSPKPLLPSVGVQTHVGRTRTENQDRVSRAATPFGDVYVLADGVGGHRGGAEAAQSTVDGFVRHLQALGGLRLPDALQNTAREIGEDLCQRSQASESLRGMSSTVVLAVVNGARATIAHVGDSRAYLIRGNRMEKLTRDHSVMQRMIDSQVLTPEQAREHPDAPVLTQAIGQCREVTMAIAEMELQPDDALLLCSDGLWGFAAPEDMEAIATSGDLSPNGVAEALLNLALQGGGGDNISIQFIRFAKRQAPGRPPRKWLGLRPGVALPLAGAVTGILVAAAGMGIFNWKHRLEGPRAPQPPLEAPSLPVPVSHVPEPNPPLAGSRGAPPRVVHSGRPVVVVITVDGLPDPPWSANLTGLAYFDLKREPGGEGCLALLGESPMLVSTAQAASVAARIRKDLKLPASSVVQIPRERIAPCGSEDVFALPARKPTLRETMSRKVEKIGEKIKKRNDKTEQDHP